MRSLAFVFSHGKQRTLMTNKGGGGGGASGESLYLTGNISGIPPAAPPAPLLLPRLPLLCRRPCICQLSEVDGGAAEKMGRKRKGKKQPREPRFKGNGRQKEKTKTDELVVLLHLSRFHPPPPPSPPRYCSTLPLLFFPPLPSGAVAEAAWSPRRVKSHCSCRAGRASSSQSEKWQRPSQD